MHKIDKCRKLYWLKRRDAPKFWPRDLPWECWIERALKTQSLRSSTHHLTTITSSRSPPRSPSRPSPRSPLASLTPSRPPPRHHPCAHTTSSISRPPHVVTLSPNPTSSPSRPRHVVTVSPTPRHNPLAHHHVITLSPTATPSPYPLAPIKSCRNRHRRYTTSSPGPAVASDNVRGVDTRACCLTEVCSYLLLNPCCLTHKLQQLLWKGIGEDLDRMDGLRFYTSVLHQYLIQLLFPLVYLSKIKLWQPF